MNEAKVFTVGEANKLLSALTELITQLHEQRDCVSDIEAQIDALELVSGPHSKKTNRELNQLVEKHHRLVAEFYAMVDQVQEHGCFLKDVDLGLIDFYGVVDGRMVYLCWQFGEQQVNHWHDIDGGYATRQPFEG